MIIVKNLYKLYLMMSGDLFIDIDFEDIDDGNSNPIDNSDDIYSFFPVIEEFFERFKYLITGILGVATLVMIGTFLYFSTKLGAVSNNPTRRKAVIIQLLLCFIGTAFLGSITVIFSLAFGVFR